MDDLLGFLVAIGPATTTLVAVAAAWMLITRKAGSQEVPRVLL